MRALRAIGAAVGLVITFVSALVAGVVIHLGLPPVRREVTALVSAALAPLFVGRLTIDGVDELSLTGIAGGRAHVDGPDGKPLLRVSGVRAHVATAQIVRSVIAGKAVEIEVQDVHVDAADVSLEGDASGVPALARAFAPRTPSPPGNGPGVRLSMASAAVAHVWAHGGPVALPPLDADLNDLGGSLRVEPGHVAIAIDRVTVSARALPRGTDAHGTIAGRIDLPSPKSADFGARVAWRGVIAGIDASADAEVDGQAIDVVADAPAMAPEALRVLWPDSPLDRPASAHAEAHGTLPRLDVTLRSTLDAASIELTGPVTLADGVHADLQLDARAVDIHTVEASAPVSRLDASGAVSLARTPDGAIAASAGIDFLGGPVGARKAPAARIDATFARDPAGAIRGEGTVTSRDPSLVGAVSAKLVPKGRSFTVTFDADARAPRLDGIAWLGPIARGRAQASARGTFDVAKEEISAHVEATADDFDRGLTHVGHASITLDARGRARAPTLDATLTGRGLDVAGFRADGVRVEAHGPTTAAHATVALRGGDLPDLDAEADVSLGATTSLRSIALKLVHAHERVQARVDRVAFGHGSVRVEDAVVEGLGAPAHLALEATSDTLHVVADARALELGRISRLFGAEKRVKKGHVTVDADVFIHRASAEGFVTADLARGEIGGVDDVSAHLDARLIGRKVVGTARVQLSDAGSLELTTAGIELGGTAPVLESWQRAWGRVVIEGHIALARAAALAPDVLPFDASGELDVHGRAWRESPTDDTLGLILAAKTTHLALAGHPKPDAPAPWRIDGIDVALDTRIDGETGFAELAARVNDSHGELAELELKADTIPYGQIVAAPARALAVLRPVAFNAQVLVPPRDVETLPPLLAIPGARGMLGAKVNVHGPLDQLTAEVAAHLARGRLADSGITMPLDADLGATYDGEVLEATLGTSSRGKKTLSGAAQVAVKISEVLGALTHDTVAPIPWSASAQAHLDGFPLESVEALSDRQIKGALTGDVTLQDLHKDAHAGVAIEVHGLQIGDVALPTGHVTGTLDGRALDADVQLAQQDGSVEVKAHAGASWGAALVPTLDPKAPLEASLVARRLRAEAFLPLVDSTFTALDGRIDADAHVALDPVARTTRLSGTVKLTEGRFELEAMGGEFHDATAEIRLDPSGVITLVNARAYGATGRIEAAASGRVDASGLSAANATVQIPSSSPLLLSVQGVQLGMVDGRADVTAKRAADQRGLDISVEIPAFNVQLPLQTARDVQQLGPIAGVRIGTQVGGAFTPLDLDPEGEPPPDPKTVKRITVAVNMREVQIRRGSTLRVTLEGRPTLVMADTLQLAGQIRVKEGTIDVQGKAFEIESGTITFVGSDPSNPQVVLTASWVAEDGTRIYADFVGPLKTGKVTLRSEPSLPKNEILAILLFGTADGATSSSASSAGSNNQGQVTGAAGGAAGGAATQPVNRALEQFGLGGVSTRVDTSNGNPRPEIAVQISRAISVQLAVVLGAPLPGQNPDRTLVTVDWRFTRAWLLATTVGDAGTSVFDLLWRRRY